MFIRNIVFIIVALVLLVVGGITLMFNTGDHFDNNAKEKVIEDQSFTNIEILTTNSAVEILPTKDSVTTVAYSGKTKKSSKLIFKADVKENTLSIQFKEKRRSFINFGFSSLDLKLIVKVPEKQYEMIQAESDNGRIKVENIQTKELALETDNGTIELNTIDATAVDIKTDNGAIILTQVDGTIIGRTDNGKISVVTNNLDRPIELTTDNGKIEIQTEKEPTNATIDVKTDNGRIDVFGHENKHTKFGNGQNLIKLRTDNGRITITK
ncbi:DUF4097 domain-containing protein [Sporosarcina sp. ANT_H38]|uniref:DUF4097 family beta strand repeat-containing protein n=1 Tax=Sporosarcina sp. ANT_H38 TaxID=2597358 RepID=UPI0011F1F8F2|nr:DUF4097 family beta strand repeat-containing protein [Sporosarcina sp. ANT_H38]KAA0965765.1 DUF4097 domain-containing protein [Sporosarcina sp. ANT_H38]